MRRIRRLIYRWGYRPKQGSIFFSPSLALVYVMKDNGVVEATIRAMNREKR